MNDLHELAKSPVKGDKNRLTRPITLEGAIKAVRAWIIVPFKAVF